MRRASAPRRLRSRRSSSATGRALAHAPAKRRSSAPTAAGSLMTAACGPPTRCPTGPGRSGRRRSTPRATRPSTSALPAWCRRTPDGSRRTVPAPVPPRAVARRAAPGRAAPGVGPRRGDRRDHHGRVLPVARHRQMRRVPRARHDALHGLDHRAVVRAYQQRGASRLPAVHRHRGLDQSPRLQKRALHGINSVHVLRCIRHPRTHSAPPIIIQPPRKTNYLCWIYSSGRISRVRLSEIQVTGSLGHLQAIAQRDQTLDRGREPVNGSPLQADRPTPQVRPRPAPAPPSHAKMSPSCIRAAHSNPSHSTYRAVRDQPLTRRSHPCPIEAIGPLGTTGRPTLLP